MNKSRPDVLIVGGGVIGCATAHFLREATALDVLVLERDPSYAHAATTRSMASIRHQFSTPLNVAMSQFGTQFLREARERLEIRGEVAPELGFREAGYLFLVEAAGLEAARAAHALQIDQGARVAWLDPDALRGRFPWLSMHDVEAGTLGLSGEGWIDGHTLLHALRRHALARGARFEQAEVTAFERTGRRIVAVNCADATRLEPRWIVLAAGTRAALLARTAGIELPVRARKRCVFHFHSPEPAPGCPLVIDTDGVYFRPEGNGFLCGVSPPEADDVDAPLDDFDVTWGLWEERLWPALARRVPGFAAARLAGAWAGHYDVHPLDHNAIIGMHPDLENLLFANGFSGHGLQHAPAVGRALAEWIDLGRWGSLDLSELGWDRVLRGQALREAQVV